MRDIQQRLKAMNWDTGLDGIRSSQDGLVLLGLAYKQLDGRIMRYRLSPLGCGYANCGPDDALFAQVLRKWPPYCAMCVAINEKGVAAAADDLITYFRGQYATYAPYAKSLFNPNKTDGLLRLYRVFGD